MAEEKKKSKAERLYSKPPRIKGAESDEGEGGAPKPAKTTPKKETPGAEPEATTMDGDEGVPVEQEHHTHERERQELHHRHMREHTEMHGRHERDHLMRATGKHSESHEEMSKRHHEEMRGLHTQHEREHREMSTRHHGAAVTEGGAAKPEKEKVEGAKSGKSEGKSGTESK